MINKHDLEDLKPQTKEEVIAIHNNELHNLNRKTAQEAVRLILELEKHHHDTINDEFLFSTSEANYALDDLLSDFHDAGITNSLIVDLYFGG